MNGNTPPDTVANLVLGLIVIFSGLSLYLASLALRYRNLQKAKARLEQLAQPASSDNERS
jgi:hypothetical protein